MVVTILELFTLGVLQTEAAWEWVETNRINIVDIEVYAKVRAKDSAGR